MKKDTSKDQAKLEALLDCIELAYDREEEMQSTLIRSEFPWMLELFAHLLPAKILDEGYDGIEEWLNHALPITTWAPTSSSLIYSIFSLSFFKGDAATLHLVSKIVSKALEESQDVELVSSEHIKFHLKKRPLGLLLATHLKLIVKRKETIINVESILSKAVQDLNKILRFHYLEKLVLEANLFTNKDKEHLAYKELTSLLKRRPRFFDSSLVDDLSRLLANASEHFKSLRSFQHLVRMALSFNHVHADLSHKAAQFSKKRYVALRLLPTSLFFPFKSRPAMGILIGLALLDGYERTEPSHILASIEELIGSVQEIKGSFYIHYNQPGPISLLYLEVEKNNLQPFSLADRKKLHCHLPQLVKQRIQVLTPSIFSVNNEEDTMKTILILSREITKVDDFPEMNIRFDQQTTTHLIFTVILVYVPKSDEVAIEEKLFSKEEEITISCERTNVVGHFNPSSPKVAKVFRFEVPITSKILRVDSSIHLSLAREKVASLIHTALGPVRDYNGGMIWKQKVLFSEFTTFFPEVNTENPDLLENFFYGITPIEKQVTLPLESFKTLFTLCLEVLKTSSSSKHSLLKSTREGETLHLALKIANPAFKKKILNLLTSPLLDQSKLSSVIETSFKEKDSYIIGFICPNRSQESSHLLLKVLMEQLYEIDVQQKTEQILRLSISCGPLSFDPRLGGGEISGAILKLLFEGLMRVEGKSKLNHAVAECYTLSRDQKVYSFKLRKAFWSNGDLITAQDFAYAWKTTLSPRFHTPFSYLFYPIKHAKAVKSAQLPVEKLGIYVISDSELVVELESPTPHFLELTANSLYAPVNHRIDQKNPNWSSYAGKDFVSNGPFSLYSANSHCYELVKNKRYWNQSEVKLNRILIAKASFQKAHQMFKNKEIDWLGTPFYPSTIISSCKRDTRMHRQRSNAQIYWYVCNCQDPFLKNANIRKALAYAINRESLLKTLAYDGEAATSILPLVHAQGFDPLLKVGDVAKAQNYFALGLKESGFSLTSPPKIKLCISAWGTRGEIALATVNRWREVLGIDCGIEENEWKELFSKACQGDYQMAGIMWKPLINSPMYTLDVFREKGHPVNFSNWEEVGYQEKVAKAIKETKKEKQYRAFAEAETILMHSLPVIPVIYENEYSVKNLSLKGCYRSDMQRIDFSRGYFEENENVLN
ncbi:MAG: peptide ABC transporter substrate-binding protein [Simkania negevensis]|nr:peptide ABC transporter substrate-binding protein [Simkania negevensis]